MRKNRPEGRHVAGPDCVLHIWILGRHPKSTVAPFECDVGSCGRTEANLRDVTTCRILGLRGNETESVKNLILEIFAHFR